MKSFQIFICPDCGGQGKIYKPKNPNDKYDVIPESIPCKRCEGSGRVKVSQIEEPFKE